MVRDMDGKEGRCQREVKEKVTGGSLPTAFIFFGVGGDITSGGRGKAEDQHQKKKEKALGSQKRENRNWAGPSTRLGGVY